ncbi:MAG: hypothetical protein GY804_09605 [Alphaproteobacteria bacterium]|nr:hypothetical protein [Alphaproteobacteria bacterium]
MMDINTALDIKNALITLSGALGQDFQRTASNVCFMNKEKFAILKEASDLWNEFQDADIVKRGEMLGITINVRPEGGWETEPIVLSES